MRPHKRMPRVERDIPLEVHEDENAHLWAVSYSDFLMALLSFFIIFFSMDEKGQSQLFLQIEKQFSDVAHKKSGLNNTKDGRQPDSQKTDDQAQEAVSSKTLQQTLKDLNVETHADLNRFVVDFPKDFFKNGDYKIIDDQKGLVSLVLNKLRPFEKDIKIYFEGHTDDRPSNKKVESLTVDNFLLSSLRASTALMIARDLGFQEKNMYIQAASSHKRNTRSLSMHVVLENEERR